MPIYEYECQACGHELEAFQKMSDPALTECPTCHGASLRKIVSSTSFQLKGTGWYATDFRDKGKPAKKDEASEAKETKETKESKESKDTKETKETKTTQDNTSSGGKSSAEG